MKITIISVGKKHDQNLASAVDDYSQRLTRAYSLHWQFIAPSGKNDDLARIEESQAILNKIPSSAYIMLLDERGTQVTSIDLSARLEVLKNNAIAQLVIVIGGAFGVDDAVRNRADFVWSLSDLVFPHQIVRLLVVEQLYRASEIARGSGYHHG
jgi:23S rRNA (pseudouridine1915-N3)-methyltransferase